MEDVWAREGVQDQARTRERERAGGEPSTKAKASARGDPRREVGSAGASALAWLLRGELSPNALHSVALLT